MVRFRVRARCVMMGMEMVMVCGNEGVGDAGQTKSRDTSQNQNPQIQRILVATNSIRHSHVFTGRKQLHNKPFEPSPSPSPRPSPSPSPSPCSSPSPCPSPTPFEFTNHLTCGFRFSFEEDEFVCRCSTTMHHGFLDFLSESLPDVFGVIE